jgi:hypothetical protein
MSTSGGQFLVYKTEDGKLKIDVQFEGEMVWLTQQHMAELFQTTQQNISLHLQNIYAEDELQLEATHKESLSFLPSQSSHYWLTLHNCDGKFEFLGVASGGSIAITAGR